MTFTPGQRWGTNAAANIYDREIVGDETLQRGKHFKTWVNYQIMVGHTFRTRRCSAEAFAAWVARWNARRLA